MAKTNDIDMLAEHVNEIKSIMGKIAREGAEDLAEEAQDRLSELSQTTHDTMSRLGKMAQKKKDRFEDYVSEEPWKVLAATLGVGIVIGFLFGKHEK